MGSRGAGGDVPARGVIRQYVQGMRAAAGAGGGVVMRGPGALFMGLAIIAVALLTLWDLVRAVGG